MFSFFDAVTGFLDSFADFFNNFLGFARDAVSDFEAVFDWLSAFAAGLSSVMSWAFLIVLAFVIFDFLRGR